LAKPKGNCVPEYQNHKNKWSFIELVSDYRINEGHKFKWQEIDIEPIIMKD